jgi:hypothetical protein
MENYLQALEREYKSLKQYNDMLLKSNHLNEQIVQCLKHDLLVLSKKIGDYELLLKVYTNDIKRELDEYHSQFQN